MPQNFPQRAEDNAFPDVLGGDQKAQIDAVRTVQAFAQEERAALRFGEATERAFAAARRRIAQRAIMTTLVIFIVFAAVGFLLWMGGHDVLTGAISAGDLTAFVFYAVLVASSGGAISETIGDLQRAAGAAERLAELRDEPPAIAEPAQPKSLPTPLQGRVRFEEVSFRYPTRTQSLALDGFDLSVAPGETVAIVGPSGAGKTTVFNLLLRFYDPEAGTIRVDGVDIRELRFADLRSALAIVPQEPVLFTASVADNIRYGRPDASEAEIVAAARAAQAHDFILQLPQGYDTQVAERSAIQQWAAATPPTFRFCFKLPKAISHSGTLADRTDAALAFIQAMSPLGARLGPIFLQLPPSYSPKHLDDLERFFLDGTVPVWWYACEDALLEKRVWMERGANTTYVRYTRLRGSSPAMLYLEALVNIDIAPSNIVGVTWAMAPNNRPVGSQARGLLTARAKPVQDNPTRVYLWCHLASIRAARGLLHGIRISARVAEPQQVDIRAVVELPSPELPEGDHAEAGPSAGARAPARGPDPLQ